MEAPSIRAKTSDTEEGRTLFIRNLSFDVNDELLSRFFSQLGPIDFAKVVKDPNTQHSRGTAFVKFKKKEDADRILLESADPANVHRFTLENRVLNLVLAVPKEEANRLRKKPTDHNSDSIPNDDSPLMLKGRNLHLAHYGIIRAGTKAAEGLSSEELLQRERLLKTKEIKLKDPNVFISDCRLCVRNLPLNVTDKELKCICLRLTTNPKTCRITECRIMRCLEPGRQHNRSLGYAFVQFDNHADALKVLNELNNNPTIFGSHRRPVVEFSLENRRALEVKMRRAQKCAMLQAKRKESSNSAQAPNVVWGRNINRTFKSAKKTERDLSKLRHPMQKSPNKSSSRILPKRFGPKRRHVNRSVMLKTVSKKPKGKLTRKQVRRKRS